MDDMSARCASPPLESAAVCQEEKCSDGGTGGGRGRAPTVLSRIRQGGPERPREPHEIEDSQPVKHRRDQTPHAIAVVEDCRCVGRRRCRRL